MSAASTTFPLPAALDLLERAVGYTRGSLGLVGPASYDLATPCSDWTVRQLLVHMSDSLLALREAGAAGSLDLFAHPDPALAPTPQVDLLEAIRSQACELLGAWSGARGGDLVRIAGSTVTAGLVVGAGALEIAVHGWDLAAGCRRPRPLATGFAAELLEVAVQVVGAQDRPQHFAAARPAPANAAAPQRLLAFLGR